ncbi:MAG: M20 aminoacylase family protein [Woeseiaceae bacterium]
MTAAKPTAQDWANWRRDMHRQPELGFQEFETAKRIADELETLGIETHTGIGRTGVVGVIKRGNSKRSLGLRADIDAIPIQEQNGFPHRSRHDGRFHGCGHDGHTAMLLSAAEMLAASDTIAGTVYFIFQPNEENGLGALAMMEDGLFDKFPMNAVFGMHNMPGLPAGSFAVRKGPMMTFEDNFVITVTGRGGHASMPNLGVDPVVVSAEIIQGLQTVVSRSLDPMEAGVVSVTEILTDGARNVIPTTVTLKGDTRGLSEETQKLIEHRMRQLTEHIGAAHGATVSLDYSHEFVVLNNSDAETEMAAEVAKSVVGADLVDANCAPASCSEDFAQMLKVKPGCYVLIGNGIDGSSGQPLHNPNYDFNDELISVGARYWTALTERVLGNAL